MTRDERLKRAIDGLNHCQREGVCEGCALSEPCDGRHGKRSHDCCMDDAVDLLRDYRTLVQMFGNGQIRIEFINGEGDCAE